jgi:hypothetical protein
MRLNGIMALIAVVCVVGVVSAEVLGPVARLRAAPRGDDEEGAGKLSVRAELADDTFQFDPTDPFLLEFLTPKLGARLIGRHALPSPAFSSVTMLFDGGGGGDDVNLVDPSTPAETSEPSALADADFTPLGGSPALYPASWTQPPPFGSVGPSGSGPGGNPPSAAPEPADWLLLMLGVGAVGVALRRRRDSAGGLPDGRQLEQFRG